MKLVSLIARGLAASILVLMVAAAGALAGMRLHGDQLYSVQTASMVPTFQPGDALVIRPVATKQIRTGQVISYRNPQNPNVIISHRVISHTTTQIMTAGDALHSPDPAIAPSQVVGQAVAVAPGLGRVLDFFHRPAGLAIFVYIPAIGLMIAELHRFAKRTQPIQYRLAGRPI